MEEPLPPYGACLLGSMNLSKFVVHPFTKNAYFDFNKFIEAVKKSPKGAFVEYQWTKLGEKDPSDKRSWVRKCKVGNSNKYWVVGSGSWK